MKRKLEVESRGCEALNISSFIENVDTASQLASRLCNPIRSKPTPINPGSSYTGEAT